MRHHVRPAYVPRSARYVPSNTGTVYRPARRWRVLLLALLGAVVLTAAMWAAGRAALALDVEAPGPAFVTPATYGPPGPNGGPT